MYYTSNERDYFSLSIDVSNFENKYGGRKWYLKRYFFYFLFLIVNISTNIVLDGLKYMYLRSMSRELCLRFSIDVLVFVLCKKKTGKLFIIDLNIVSKFYKKKTN